MTNEEYIKELKELYEKAKKEGRIEIAFELLVKLRSGADRLEGDSIKSIES